MKVRSLYTIIPYKDRLLQFTKAKSARGFFKHHYVDLLTGATHSYPFEDWLKELNHPIEAQKEDKRVVHLFYELGFLFEGLSDEVGDLELLAIDIHYARSEDVQELEKKKKLKLKLKESPAFQDYQKKFIEGYGELEKGNCYQFNLTGKYLYSFEEDYGPFDFISSLWEKKQNRGLYGSATYIPWMDKLYLSNSPECLFQYEKGILTTRPIKGTLKNVGGDPDLLWEKLKRDQKSRAELYMITDLLRNDLCRIEWPCARVTKKRAKLLVPGLIHQYSEISIPLGPLVTIKDILKNIFPGGSITGAPKKRVMQLLKKLEGAPRGFYCGSTVLFSSKGVSASINIRSSEIDFKKRTLLYCAGGGITLKSTVESEFEEMNLKRASTIDLLT